MASKGRADVTTALISTGVSGREWARDGVSPDAQLGECRREFTDVMTGRRDDRGGHRAVLAEALDVSPGALLENSRRPTGGDDRRSEQRGGVR